MLFSGDVQNYSWLLSICCFQAFEGKLRSDTGHHMGPLRTQEMERKQPIKLCLGLLIMVASLPALALRD